MAIHPALSALVVGLLVGARLGHRGRRARADRPARPGEAGVAVVGTTGDPAGVPSLDAGRVWPRNEPTHHTIVEMDVTGSGCRNDQLQLQMRADLHTVVRNALARQRLDPRAIGCTDLGDGMRLIVPARISPHAVLDPFLPNLTAGLNEHRAAAAAAAGIRLRVAVHMGLLHRDAHGWAGAPLVHCSRLLNASPVRRALADARNADLVLVVSEAIYTDVIQHGYGLNPAAYSHVRIREKGTAARAWIQLPAHPVRSAAGHSGAASRHGTDHSEHRRG